MTRRLDHFRQARGEPVAHKAAGTYCQLCGLFLKKDRPKWLLDGGWFHHHCARHTSAPPPATVCREPGCRNSTAVQYAEGGEFEILPLCWLHVRGERALRGLGIAGDIQRRAEQVKAAEEAERDWLKSRGYHQEGSVVDGS
jgi:hypothetical protein